MISSAVPELLPPSPKRAWSPSYSPTSPPSPEPEEQEMTLVEEIEHLKNQLKKVKSEKIYLKARISEAEKRAERAEKKIEKNTKPSVYFSWVRKSKSTQTPDIPLLQDHQLIYPETTQPAKKIKTN